MIRPLYSGARLGVVYEAELAFEDVYSEGLLELHINFDFFVDLNVFTSSGM